MNMFESDKQQIDQDVGLDNIHSKISSYSSEESVEAYYKTDNRGSSVVKKIEGETDKGHILNTKQDRHESHNCPSFSPSLEKLFENPGQEILSYVEKRYSKPSGLDHNQTQFTKEELIYLCQGQSDKKTPDFIASEAMRALQEGHTTYGCPLGESLARQALSTYYQRIYGAKIEESRLALTPSGTASMQLCLNMALGPGDHVVVVTPIWKNFMGALELSGADISEVSLELSIEGDFSLDLDKLFSAVRSDTKAIIVVTPSNPTGWMASHEEIKAILDFSRQKGIWIISDEVYGRMVYEDASCKTHKAHKVPKAPKAQNASHKNHLINDQANKTASRAPSFLEHATREDAVFVVNSFSKNWSMTGWRLGWIVGPRWAEEKIKKTALYSYLCPPAFTQYGAIAALEKGEEFLSEHKKLWTSNRDIVLKTLGAMDNVKLLEPRSTYYALFSVDGYQDSVCLCQDLVDKAGIVMAPGSCFGSELQGYVRLCFAVSEEKLIKVLQRIKKAI